MPSKRLVLLAVTIMFAVTVMATGCSSSSILLRRDDRTYDEARHRYETTRQLVEAEPVPKPEAAMFLQAEAFYRYRVTPPRRSVGGYLAEGAAAALDFPAFQAIAASLDLFDLRLKANDGAIQLWETLLDWYPRTSLRALTLYRLGWAYRSNITAGFPHGDPKELFEQLGREYPTSPLAPLAREAAETPRKAPRTATSWSLVPGAGQLYAGETGNGLSRLAIALVGAALVVVPSAIAAVKANRGEPISTGEGLAYAGTAIGGLVVLSIDYTLAYQDALRAVMQFNEREELKFGERHPDAP